MGRLGLLLALVAPVGLVLAACGGKEPPPPLALDASGSGLSRGIDMATDARDVSQELKGSSLHFVARYYRDPASRLPPLSAEEARAVTAAGKKLVAVWQYKSNKPEHFSYASGQADGMAAHRQAKAVGQPPGTAIYFAVDYNAPEPDVRSLIDPYFRGVAAGLAAAAGKQREYRIGVYSSGAVCSYLKGARLAELTWLSHSRAWAGYGSFTGWDIKQGPRSAALSFDHDMNEARGEFGAFTVKGQSQFTIAGS
jgi:hypothetical protein